MNGNGSWAPRREAIEPHRGFLQGNDPRTQPVKALIDDRMFAFEGEHSSNCSLFDLALNSIYANREERNLMTRETRRQI